MIPKHLLEEYICDIRKRFGAKRIGIFGSYEKEIRDIESDGDVPVEFEESNLKINRKLRKRN